MEQATCSGCEHFLQHYALTDRKLLRVYCGHCTAGRAKHVKPDKKSCAQFHPGTPDVQAFASREYLSRELLQYVLNLPLLPEIENAPEL